MLGILLIIAKDSNQLLEQIILFINISSDEKLNCSTSF